jgi:hypothetical protein
MLVRGVQLAIKVKNPPFINKYIYIYYVEIFKMALPLGKSVEK